MFCGEQIPACGFSLGLERILVVMTERGMFPPSAGLGPDVLVTIFDDDLTAESLKLAAELRARRPARRGLSRAAEGRQEPGQGLQVRRCTAGAVRRRARPGRVQTAGKLR
jgi:histidyl-tRNA synthetase